MSRLTDMEAAFEEWFQARRRDTFGPDRAGNRLSDHPNWSMGLRSWLHEGWMGAVLWCRLCRREHEGACAAPSAEQQPDIDAFLGEGRKPVRSLASVMVPSARDPEQQPENDPHMLCVCGHAVVEHTCANDDCGCLAFKRAATAPSEQQPNGADEREFEAGWRAAASWAHRDDLLADIGSPAYLADRAKALAQQPEQQPTAGGSND